MLAYLISSIHETDRIKNIDLLKKQLNEIIHIEAVYPKNIHVPFLDKILIAAKNRTNRVLKNSELGLLLSHRAAWESLLKNSADSGLVLESDSMLINKDILQEYFTLMHQKYDLFFWGAFDGRIKIYNRDRLFIQENYYIGTPVINSLFCSYGYSINKKAANYLLLQTNHVNYPIDFWKYRLKNSNLKIGGVFPEIISTAPQYKSTIQTNEFNIYNFKFINFLIDLKNTILSYL